MPRKVRRAARTATERAARERHCRKLVAEQPRSGLSIQAFAEKHGMSAGAFAYWRRKVARDGVVGPRRGRRAPAQPQFVQVSVAGTATAPTAAVAYEILIGNGRVLRVPADFDEDRVAALLRLLATC